MNEEDCPGKGSCHGCVKWCPACGEVDQTCDAPGCEQHLPCEYPGCSKVGYEGRCLKHWLYDPETVARTVLED